MTIDFELNRAKDARERRTFEKRKGKILFFRLQLEILVGDEWKAVKRWDSSHGFVDCDTYNLKGETKKEILKDVSLEEGLTRAQDDLNENWKVYRGRFLKGGSP